MIAKIEKKNGINFIAHLIRFDSAEEIKNLLFELKNEVPDLMCVLAAEVNGKPSISVIVNDTLVKEKNINAGNIVRDLAKEINGGGGGQAFYAQAGGSNLQGLANAIEKAKKLMEV
jgi:alanyl-tRNA synthetase